MEESIVEDLPPDFLNTTTIVHDYNVVILPMKAYYIHVLVLAVLVFSVLP